MNSTSLRASVTHGETIAAARKARVEQAAKQHAEDATRHIHRITGIVPEIVDISYRLQMSGDDSALVVFEPLDGVEIKRHLRVKSSGKVKPTGWTVAYQGETAECWRLTSRWLLRTAAKLAARATAEATRKDRADERKAARQDAD